MAEITSTILVLELTASGNLFAHFKKDVLPHYVGSKRNFLQSRLLKADIWSVYLLQSAKSNIIDRDFQIVSSLDWKSRCQESASYLW